MKQVVAIGVERIGGAPIYHCNPTNKASNPTCKQLPSSNFSPIRVVTSTADATLFSGDWFPPSIRP
ncbi:MAG: hypothetical protein Q8J99_17350, partial [Sulfuritalea sp.]|nr:hypothetical protein [Sulfuritalea sp.]